MSKEQLLTKIVGWIKYLTEEDKDYNSLLIKDFKEIKEYLTNEPIC